MRTQELSNRFRISLQPSGVASNRFQRLHDRTLRPRTLVLLKERLHLLRPLLASEILRRKLHEARHQKTARIPVHQLGPVVFKELPRELPSSRVVRHGSYNENRILRPNLVLKKKLLSQELK